MIPLKDNIPSSTFPFVNISLIVVNIIIFFYEVSLGPYLERFIFHFGVIPQKFLVLFSGDHFYPVATFFPLFTSLFLHGGWLHVGGNMLYLWIFGDNVEDLLGHVQYLLFYILCGIGSGLTHIITQPGSHIPTIGASGAIAGVMGAYFVLFPKARVITLVPIFFFIQFIEIPAFFFLAFWFFMQLVSGTFAGSSQFSGGIAFWAHIGGFVCGILLLLFFKRQRRARYYYR
jgi:membrane associated rhomboid family serine protease